ncbi:MAG: hypothetical protein HXY28_08570 [Hydrogenophilaceae bacterium]|nr:hypothetical protein [Hydrogenophilaceae bacterium]
MPGEDRQPPDGDEQEDDPIGRWTGLALFVIYAALALTVIAPIVFMMLNG